MVFTGYVMHDLLEMHHKHCVKKKRLLFFYFKCDNYLLVVLNQKVEREEEGVTHRLIS